MVNRGTFWAHLSDFRGKSPVFDCVFVALWRTGRYDVTSPYRASVFAVVCSDKSLLCRLRADYSDLRSLSSDH